MSDGYAIYKDANVINWAFFEKAISLLKDLGLRRERDERQKRKRMRRRRRRR